MPITESNFEDLAAKIESDTPLTKSESTAAAFIIRSFGKEKSEQSLRAQKLNEIKQQNLKSDSASVANRERVRRAREKEKLLIKLDWTATQDGYHARHGEDYFRIEQLPENDGAWTLFINNKRDKQSDYLKTCQKAASVYVTKKAE